MPTVSTSTLVPSTRIPASADRDYVSTGVISKDPIDYTPQSPGLMKRHGAAPNTESLTSSSAALSHAAGDRYHFKFPTGAFSEDAIDHTPQYPGSTSRSIPYYIESSDRTKYITSHGSSPFH
jgi:hypothetical protein